MFFGHHCTWGDLPPVGVFRPNHNQVGADDQNQGLSVQALEKLIKWETQSYMVPRPLHILGAIYPKWGQSAPTIIRLGRMTTGCPRSNLAERNYYISENMHIWHHFSKVKIHFKNIHFFDFLVFEKLEKIKNSNKSSNL